MPPIKKNNSKIKDGEDLGANIDPRLPEPKKGESFADYLERCEKSRQSYLDKLHLKTIDNLMTKKI